MVSSLPCWPWQNWPAVRLSLLYMLLACEKRRELQRIFYFHALDCSWIQIQTRESFPEHSIELLYNKNLQYRPFVTLPSRIRLNFFEILWKITNFVRILCTKFTYEFVYEFVHEIKTKEKIPTRNFKNSCSNLNKERNLCTNLNRPTRLHQDRHSKTSSFDNYMISLKVNLLRLYQSFQPTIVFVRIIHH